jgi:hypothetical protein
VRGKATHFACFVFFLRGVGGKLVVHAMPVEEPARDAGTSPLDQ